MVKYMAVAVAVAVAVSGGGAVAVAVAVAGLTKRFFNHIQKDFLINVWGYDVSEMMPPSNDTSRSAFLVMASLNRFVRSYLSAVISNSLFFF